MFNNSLLGSWELKSYQESANRLETTTSSFNTFSLLLINRHWMRLHSSTSMKCSQRGEMEMLMLRVTTMMMMIAVSKDNSMNIQ